MESERSPLDKLLARPDFKPFAGRQAFRVLKLVKTRLKMPPIREEDVLKAVSSLGIIVETEVAMAIAMQDIICQRCGDCCRNRGTIRFRKDELQAAADHLHVEYKRLKDKIGATPMGDGTFIIGQPCRFLKDNRCIIYSVRPGTCRGYPSNDMFTKIGRRESFEGCPIADPLLTEIVVKRVLEEQMWRENPGELKRLVEKRRVDLAKLAGLPQGQRMKLLVDGYTKSIQREPKS